MSDGILSRLAVTLDHAEEMPTELARPLRKAVSDCLRRLDRQIHIEPVASDGGGLAVAPAPAEDRGLLADILDTIGVR